MRLNIILGEGKPLFGPIEKDIRLEDTKAVACPSDYIQIHCKVRYD